MLRIMIVVLLAASSVISGLDRKDATGAPSQAPNRLMHVTVSFGGLMVFHPSRSAYDVGILTDTAAPGHKFKVIIDGDPPIERKDLPKFPSWSLSVTHSSTGVDQTNIGPDEGRKKEKKENQYDFRWMIDLDELHRGLKPKSGLLNPIIHLKDGLLYSLFKTEFMDSHQGIDRFAPFGFFTETVALDIEVPEGEELVLAPDDGGTPVFRLPYNATHPTHQVAIKNIRDPMDHSVKSDFRMYYNLFEPIDKKFQYDFQLNTKPPAGVHNPAPHKPTMLVSSRGKKDMTPFTCCGLECNVVLLNTTPLK